MRTTVTDLSELRRYEPEWRRLALRRGNAFLTPEWFQCWHRYYGEGFTPFVTVLTAADGRLRGLLPLALARTGHPRTCSIAGANLGDHFHPVAEPEDEAEVGSAAGEALSGASQPWSVIVLDHVETGSSSWVTALEEATSASLRYLNGSSESLPMIDLSRYSDWEEYLGSRSKNLRSQIRRATRRAAHRGELRLRLTGSGELDSDLETFFHLHDLRFGAHSSLRGERVRAFHADFASAALERGWLRLRFLELDGQPVAAEYGCRIGQRYGFLNGGFDPAFSELSPGAIIRSKVIQAAFDEGIREFDFLLGGESHKLRYANLNRTVDKVTLVRTGHPAHLMASTEQLARRVGRMVPPGARRRIGLDRLARHSLLRGKGR